MMLETNKTRGVIRGCLVPVLTVAGLLAACYLVCMVLFILNQNAAPKSSFFFFFGG